MGYFSELQIEIEEIDAIEATDERALDFDQRNYLDGAWWADLEAEQMEAERMQQIESLAEIVENRVNGYGE